MSTYCVIVITLPRGTSTETGAALAEGARKNLPGWAHAVVVTDDVDVDVRWSE